jgi:hypothetical protein
MDKIETKHRRKLNEDQAQVLELLYKFRFGSNDLFAQYFGKKDRSFVFKRLKILLDQALIGKRFDSSYRIQGKPAAYYLLPAGARRLPEYRDADDADEINIKGIYKDKIVSEQFVARCLDIFTLYNRFTSVYDDKLVFLTKSDLASRDHFPKQPPDAHLRFELDEDDKEFFLLIHYSHDQFFAAIRRLQHYVKHAGSEEWEKAEQDFPAIVMVFESQTDQKRFHKKAARIMNEAPDDVLLYTATLDDLKAITNADQEVLCSFDDPDEMFSFLDA